jgi:hypothetical protein
MFSPSISLGRNQLQRLRIVVLLARYPLHVGFRITKQLVDHAAIDASF